jgi:glycosyltransferase involved in cell wall biosynthesis
MSLPRVVHVVAAGEIGGAEHMLCDLASRSSSGAIHAVALFTPNSALVRLLLDAGLRVHDRGRIREDPLAFLRRSLGARDVGWLARVMVAEAAGIAHLHTFASHVVGTRAALRAGARVLRTEHSTRAFDDPTCWPFSRWSLTHASASVAISSYVRAAALARAPWAAPKIRVIPDGIDLTRFAPQPMPTAQAFTFAFLGRLEPRKGADLAIQALAQVPAARLEIVGEGEQRARLERLVEALGISARIRFHGYLADPRPVLAAAHAVLCSSRAEGLGIAMVEAMAMGRPIVGFAVGGVPEVVVHDRTGWLVPPGDVDALAARMRELVRRGDRLVQVGLEARAQAVRHFSVDAMCSGYAQAYRELNR